MITHPKKSASLGIVLCIALITQLNAQTGTTKLNVVLSSVLSITVNNATVSLNFSNLAAYQNGVSTPQVAHLTLTSILPYTVSVRAASETMPGTVNTSSSINASAVTITAPTGTNNDALPGKTLGSVASLSNSNQTLISGSYAVALPADVTYSIPQAKVSEVLGKPVDTYSVDLTYTISNP